MANRGVLIDTGPLVAILSGRDQHHQRCVQAARTIRGPMYTAWPVLTEAAYLLRTRADKVQLLLAQVRNGRLQLLQLDQQDVQGITRILTQYSDQDLDLADAALAHLAVREGIKSVFTIDDRHFSMFRTADGRPLALVPLAAGQ